MKTYKEISPFSGQDIDEDAPANSVAGGGVSMPPDAVKKKKKTLLDRQLMDARTKTYRTHRAKLEAARVKREAKKKSKFIEKVKESVTTQEYTPINEAKYDLYHKDFSTAMQHAYKMAKKLHGITIDPKEIDDKVATGPSKPGSGKTNKYSLKGDKGSVQIQVYNKGGSKPFELNMYKS
jgi:hypothetical protein